MSEKTLRHSENAAGAYYVDQNCIAAKLCTAVAPKNFRMSESGVHAVLWKQPANAAEEAQCAEARDACPVFAIGDDGDQ